MNGIEVSTAALIQRRKHGANGCAVSIPTGVVDARCDWCKEFDAALAFITSLGWQPTAYDDRFLHSLRIDAR